MKIIFFIIAYPVKIVKHFFRRKGKIQMLKHKHYMNIENMCLKFAEKFLEGDEIIIQEKITMKKQIRFSASAEIIN